MDTFTGILELLTYCLVDQYWFPAFFDDSFSIEDCEKERRRKQSPEKEEDE